MSRSFVRMGLGAPAAFVALVLLGSGCATSGEPDEPGEPSRNRSLISEEEIRAATVADLYSLVERLRPQWFRIRRVASPAGLASRENLVIYFDRSRRGGPDTLRGVPTDGVISLRHYSGTEAQQRFGTDHRMGAIVVEFAPRR